MTFMNSAALSKIRHTAGTCHSVLTKRCAFRRRAKVAMDSVDRRSSAGNCSKPFLMIWCQDFVSTKF